MQRLRLKLSRCFTVIVAIGVLHNLSIIFRDDMQEPENVTDEDPPIPTVRAVHDNADGRVARSRIVQRYFQ